jgi:hypothetical protein
MSLVLAACGGSGGSKQAATSTTLSPSTAAGSGTAAPSPPTSGVGCPSAAGAAGGQGGREVTPPGDIPDNQAFVVFRPTTGTYQVSIPEGWTRTETGGTARFTDKFNSIVVETSPAATAPTVATAQQSEVPHLTSVVPCFGGAKVSSVTRHSGPAVLITYQADSAPDPVTAKTVRQDVERYEFWKAGNEVAVTLSSPTGSDNVDPWRKITDSFAWTA